MRTSDPKVVFLPVAFLFLAAGATLLPAQFARADEAAAKVSLKGGRLSIKSADDDFSLKIGGRLQADYGFYSGDAGGNELEGAGEFRRARLFVSGNLWKKWEFKAQYDFAGNDLSMKDAYLGYKGPVKVRVGHVKEPFGLETLTSSKYVTFIERAMPNIFAPERNLGLTVQGGASNWSLAGGVFQQGLEGDEGAEDAFDLAGRGTYSFKFGDRSIAHLGIAGVYTDLGDETPRFRSRPEGHQFPRLVDTGSLSGTDDMFRYGIEAAAVHGRFSVQGEYMGANVSRAGDSFATDTDDTEVRLGGFQDVDLSGFYIQASAFLTDDSRKYSAGSGSFKRIKPSSIFGKGGIGAWELGVRYSNVDLSDSSPASVESVATPGAMLSGDLGVDGGDMDTFTFGVNWHATETIRFSANYVTVLSVDGGDNDGDEPDVFLMRAQVEF